MKERMERRRRKRDWRFVRPLKAPDSIEVRRLRKRLRNYEKE